MPDNILDSLLNRLGSGTKSIASNEASRNLNTNIYNAYNTSEIEDIATKHAQEIKATKVQKTNDLKESGVTEEDVKNQSRTSEFWSDIFNKSKEVLNTLLPGSAKPIATALLPSDIKAKSTEQIKDELVTTFNEGKSFDRAIKNGIVKTTTANGKPTYSSLEDEMKLMDDDDAFDKYKYSLGTEKDILGNKKLSIGRNNGGQSKYFYYLDKDEKGNDILAKTEVANWDTFKKQGKHVLNAYGPTSFNKGFWRELAVGLQGTAASLTSNLVDVNRAAANLIGGYENSGDLTKSWAKSATDFGKRYNRDLEINQSQQGNGGGLEWAGGGIGQGISSLAQMAVLGSVANKLGALIAPEATLTSKFQYLTNFGAGSVLNFDEAYKSALDAGLSEKKAASVGALTGAINGLIESSIGSNRLFNYLSGGGDKKLARAVLNELGNDVSEKGINKVFDSFKKGLTGDASSLLNRIFEKKIIGTGLEEGAEELFQTFSQRGVENLYDIFLARDKKEKEGKFGTKFISKATAVEALESAFFGALLGGGGDITAMAMEKIGWKQSSKDEPILEMIADGKKNEVEALVATMHSGKIISDSQKEFYLNRLNQLDKLYSENKGTFKTLDTFDDKEKATNVKKDALNTIANVFELEKNNEDLGKKLTELENSDSGDKVEKTKDLQEEIKKNKLNIKFFNEYVNSEFTAREDGKVNAYENNFLNQKEILDNKWQRFLNIENIKNIEKKIETHQRVIESTQVQLDNNDTSETPKEIRQNNMVAQINVSFLNNHLAEEEKRTLGLVDEYNKITSNEYQEALKNKKEAVKVEETKTEAEPVVTTPVEAEDELHTENNTNTQEDVETAPVVVKDQLEKELTEVQDALNNSSELDEQTINQLSEREQQISDELFDLKNNKDSKQEDFDTFLREQSLRNSALSKLDPETTEEGLSAIKKEIEQTMPAFTANGVDITALKNLHEEISNKLLDLRNTAKAQKDDADRLEKEQKEAKDNDDKVPFKGINYFNRVQRTHNMNTTLSKDYYTDAELEELLNNVTIEELLNEVELVFVEGAQFMPVGQVLKTFNSNLDYINPNMIVSLSFRGKKLGNLQQFDGFTSNKVTLAKLIEDENFDSSIFNTTKEQLEALKDRNTKLNTLLREKGLLTSEDLKNLGFNIQWTGSFNTNERISRTLIQDFKAAQLEENGGKPYVYDTNPDSNREITSGLIDMRQVEGVPPIPNLGDRYVVLLKSTNGKFYWAGAQNQVLDDARQTGLYNYLFKKVAELKTMTDPEAIKAEVSKINKYLSDSIFVTKENAELQLTTPNATNKGYNLRLKSKKGKAKQVALDNSLYATMGELLDKLGLDKLNLRTTLANNANAKETFSKLSVNLDPNFLSNPESSFSFDSNKLNDSLIGAVTVDNPIEPTTEAVDENYNPFEGDTFENEVEETTSVEEQATETPTTEDLSQFDKSFDNLSDDLKNQIRTEIGSLLDNYNTLKPITKKGVERKVKAIINKYTSSNNNPVFSIGTAEEIMDYPQAVAWLQSHLPSSIGIDDINILLGNIKNNGMTFGAFVNNIVYLNSRSEIGTQYHEAFHAVFRSLLGDKQIQSALAITARKYGRPTSAQLIELRNKSSVHLDYTDKQLSDLWLEEKMAREYQDQNNSLDKNSPLQAIFNKIKNWFNFITNNMDEVQALFYNINRGKFKNAKLQNNIFSRYANQNAVFSIYNKGKDVDGNFIYTNQSEGQVIVAKLTNKLLQIKLGLKSEDAETQDKFKQYKGLDNKKILDLLIADQARYYSIDDNPYYNQFLLEKGVIDEEGNITAHEEAEAFFEEMSLDLERNATIFTDLNNIAAIQKDVEKKIRIFEIEKDTIDENELSYIDEVGEQYDKDVWTMGGETSFSKALREYISLVTIKTKDKYGQDDESAVDFQTVYRGLIRGLAGIEEDQILPRFKALAEFDPNINAVYNTLIGDLGLTKEGNISVQDMTKGYDLWRKFVTAFNNEKVGWYTILHSNTQSRLIESNTASAKDIQFNNWLQNFTITSENIPYNEELKKKVESDLDYINRSENISVSLLEEAKKEAISLKEAFNTVSIKLSNAYLTYSLLKKTAYDELDQESKDFLDAFSGVPGLYDGGNVPFIVSEFKSGANPFLVTMVKGKERGATSRLKVIADQNSLFDPTIGESSFQNADGKTVYSILRPSFGLVKLRWIADAKKRTELLNNDKNKKDNFIDPLDSVTLNHLLADPNVDLILKALNPSMIDGYRRTSIDGDETIEGDGVTFGKFNAQQYMLADILMFLSNRKAINSTNENGKVEKVANTAMFNINQMEASNTGYGVFLPVGEYSEVNNDILNKMFNYLAQEVIRINNVKATFDENGKPLEGTTRWKGYNTKTSDRGFKLMEFVGYGLDEYINEITNKKENVTAEDIYAELLYEKDKILESIKNKLQDDIEAYSKALDNNAIFENLPRIELINRGYIKDGENLDAKSIKKLTTDFYLNSYLNTLGINNLLLDNYSRKVKNTVDWFKRAKGIIGSGPDMGKGVTKVAVYKEPLKYIDTKTLGNIDKQELLNVKNNELNANEDLTPEQRSKLLNDFEKQLDKGQIQIADAQSYVTLDHKILQLKRWGRFPTSVKNIYKKIQAGQNITWSEAKILEDNNAALNSTKTVAYNGDYYFKLSELILSPRLVGKTDAEGNVIFDENGRVAEALEGREYLFNKYNAMLDQGVDQALPESASKMATIAPAEYASDGKFNFTNSIMEIENKFKRLQVETPSGKTTVLHGTQLIQLISSEQEDNLPIDFPYNTDIKTLGELRTHYRRLLADNRLEGFKTALAYIRDPLSGEFNSKELTKKFYNTVLESSSNEVMVNFFTPDQNGERQFNWNLGPIVSKAEELFLAHFSKGVLSQKVPGLKVSLVSDVGFKIKDPKTGKMRSLAHMVKDEDGNYYSECLLPPFANELLGKNPSDARLQEVLKMFGVRIPTQDKHSMISLKVVGFLPVEYGSIGVFPKEIVFLSGADFDIDSEFIHRADFYTGKDGIPILYGTAKTDEDKFKEYKKWNVANNKLLKSRIKDAGYSYTKITTEQLADVMKSIGLVSSIEEFIEKQPINIGVNNNAMLSAQIKFLTNDYVREGSATVPSSMDSIKEVEKIVREALELTNENDVSPNTPLARFNANRNNMEGKLGIGPVALANIAHALLSSNGVELLNSITLPIITDRKATGFSGVHTIDSTTNRKNDNISTLLSAMTDNAKEQLAKILNLTFDPNTPQTNTLPVAAYMLSVGYTMKEAILFLNQPSIKAFVTGDKDLNDKLDNFKIQFESKVENKNINKALDIEYLTNSLNINNITYEDYDTQNRIFTTFIELQNQASYAQSITAVMSLNKGLKSTFDDNNKVNGAIINLQLDFLNNYITDDVESYDDLIKKLEKDFVIRKVNGKYIASRNIPGFEVQKNPNKTPFDARIALLNDANSIQNIIIHNKVMKASKEFFLLNTSVFQKTSRLLSLDSKALIPFFMDKSYKAYLEQVEPDKYNALMQANSNAGNMIHKSDNNIGRQLWKLKKDPKFRDNLLIKLLRLSEPRNGSSIVQIEFPTRVKAEGDFYTDLNNAFKELFMNPSTRDFARNLYYYSYFKDGLQFKNKSFINTIPTWVFKDISTSLDLLNDDFKNDNYNQHSLIKQGLIPSIVDLLTSFTRIDKLVNNLNKKVFTNELFSLANNTIKYDDKKLKHNNIVLDFTSLAKYEQSIKDADLDDLHLKLNYSIAYKYDAQQSQDPNAKPILNSKIIKSLKGFNENGDPVTMTLEDVVKYYYDNGKLPIAYEVVYDNVVPIKESGLNSSISDNQFIDNYIAVKKTVTTEPSIEEQYSAQETLNNIGEQEVTEVKDNNIDKSFIKNYSGGATGSDTEWQKIGKEFGIETINYTPETLSKLNIEQTTEVEAAYKKAAKDLGRNELDKNSYSGGLVRRDYLQAKAGDEVIAIGEILNPGETNKKGYKVKSKTQSIDGGTGYAVQMALNLGKPVYIFNQRDNFWYEAQYSNNLLGEKQFVKFIKTETPTIKGKFTGVGTREINENGKQAIRDVYENTFGNLENTEENTIFADNPSGEVQDGDLGAPSEINNNDDGYNDMINYQNNLDQINNTEEKLNKLDGDVNNFTDASDNPIC